MTKEKMVVIEEEINQAGSSEDDSPLTDKDKREDFILDAINDMLTDRMNGGERLTDRLRGMKNRGFPAEEIRNLFWQEAERLHDVAVVLNGIAAGLDFAEADGLSQPCPGSEREQGS